jgi:uncharacterized protein YjbI with pentapeptide repeats
VNPETSDARGDNVGRVPPTQSDWTAAISFGAAILLIGGIVALFVFVSSELVRSTVVGLGASVLALAASVAVVDGFRRSVIRTADASAVTSAADVRNRGDGRVQGGGRQLKGVDLREAHLIGALLVDADLVDARLDGAVLSDARLDGALLSRASLAGAVLQRASFVGADLRHANLRRADLTGAVLTRADLTSARLQGAVLRDAQLANASFVSADLRRADMTTESLEGADFAQADLRSTELPKQLDESQRRQAVTDKEQPSFIESCRKVVQNARGRIKRQWK